MKKIKLILAATLFTTLFSCINNDNYADPDLSGECSNLTATKTVQNIATAATGTAQQYTADDIIEAYVTSSDEGGNFYKSISLVSIDGTKGFSMPIDAYNLYTKYEPGRKVFVNLNKRYYANNDQTYSLEIGSLYNGTDVGRISGVEYETAVKRGCAKVDENTLVNHMTIAAAKNNANLNKLIEFDAVQFADESLGKTYFDKSLNASPFWTATNHYIKDATGASIIVRISEFATFSTKSVPSGNGKIRGILTRYNGDYQFMVRTENDVMLTNPRLTIDYAPPVGGSAISYLGSFTENFESYTAGTITTGQTNFPKYVNDPAVGFKYWYTATFSSNKYIVMSSFTSNTALQDQNNKTYFIVPIDFTAANNMKFKTQDRFDVGGVLKVYTSTNYVPGGNITAATLTNITSNFTIASGTTGSATTAFEPSGTYNFPTGLTGNGFIIFEYTGGYSFNPDLTTTMHLDDIEVN